MKRVFTCPMLLCFTLFLLPSIGFAQSTQDGLSILKQGQELAAKASSKEDMENALKKYEEALGLFERIGSDQGKGLSLLGIANVYSSQGQYQKALEYYEKSLSITQNIGDVKQEGITLNNIGMVYDSWGQYQKALEYYEKSLPIRQKIGDVKGVDKGL